MKLDEFIAGSIYIDTNILYMYLRADLTYLPVIKSFLVRIVKGEIQAFISIPVLDELYYRLLLARIKEKTDRNPLDILRENQKKAVDEHSLSIEKAVRRLTTLPHITLAGVDVGDLDAMLLNIREFSLLPRDALHVAIIRRFGLDSVASDDTDFDRVDGLKRHWVVNPAG